VSDEILNQDPLTEYARVRLRDFYLSQTFRDQYRGEELFFLLFQSGLNGALISIPFWFVLMIPAVWRLVDATRYPRAVVVGLLLLSSAFALWMDRRVWQRERDELSRRAATDSDFDIANDYLQKFGSYVSTTSDHEWQVVLRMRELAGWYPSRWGGPEESDRS
jgi:uncharacterized membrane protein YqjE